MYAVFSKKKQGICVKNRSIFIVFFFFKFLSHIHTIFVIQSCDKQRLIQCWRLCYTHKVHGVQFVQKMQREEKQHKLTF